ncbi:MFS transporter [Stetteria hydrogenophila]
MPGPRLHRNVVALAVFNALRGVTVGGFMTLFSMYMKRLGYSMNAIGGVISASSLALALILPLMGYVIDRYGPRLMVALMGLLAAVAPLVAAYSGSLAWLGLAYGIFQLSFMAGQPARMGFLAASVGVAGFGSAVGVTSSAFSAMRIVGPALAGLLASRYGFRLAFQALAASTLAGLAAFTTLSVPVKSPSKPRSVAESYRHLLRPPRGFSLVLGFASIDRFAWSLWFPLLSAHLYAAGYREDEVGYIVALAGVTQTLLLPITGRATDRAGSWAVLAASESLGLAAALLYAAPEPWQRAVAAAVLTGSSVASWIPAYNKLIAKITGGHGGAYAAANTARSLAGAPAPYVGGYLYDSLAPWAPFASSAILLAAAAAYALTALRGVEAGAPPTGQARARGPAGLPQPPEPRGLRGA